MKITSTILLLFFFNNLFAQAIEETIPEIYYSNSDTIRYKFSNYPKTYKLYLRGNDTVSPGTDNSEGIIMTAYIGNDTLQIYGDNFPYSKRSFVTIQTPKGKSVVAFRYNSVSSNFPQEYMDKNEGKINFEIPEVYELANIIWTLSPSGNSAKDLNKNSKYFNEIETYFKPYLNHPIFKKLDFDEDKYFENYYDFRENSFIYKFNEDKIINGGNYNYVMGNDRNNFNNLFKELIPLIEDFAKQSNFRKFYSSHQKYYSKEIKRLRELLPVRSMWTWLENGFPNKKINSYKIVTSPLIGGSHSTQIFNTRNPKTNSYFSEVVMFVCGSDRYDSDKKLTEKQKAGLMSGVIFTEIDHNYVNRESTKYKDKIDRIYTKENHWLSDKEQFYNNPMLVFNEYMTHSLFCLWVSDYFDEETANFVINAREDLNIHKRNFCNFKEFNQELIKLYKSNPNSKIVDLFPLIIEWSKNPE